MVGLQAQNPLDPYLALWSRLDGFDPHGLGRLVEDRSLVRIVVMRGTVHLVTAEDAARLRPLMQPVLDAEISRHSGFAPHLAGVDMEPVLAFARKLLAATPLDGGRLRTALAEHFPDLHAPALAYACRCLLPLVQVPPRGVWGRTLQATLTPLDAWAGGDGPPPVLSLDDVTLRYLGAFGPATVADVAAWSRLPGWRPVIERLRPQLRSFRGERGQELFDLLDAPRPDPGTPAPVRFLPEYDNVLLSHADRSRFAAGRPDWVAAAIGPYKGSVLVDGTVAAIWHVERDQKAGPATIVVDHMPLPKVARTRIEAGAGRVAKFWVAGAASHDVRLVPVG
ncbi:MAG: winged helix DNA-binding domain-containing protein [Acidimicrobiia bacterium]